MARSMYFRLSKNFSPFILRSTQSLILNYSFMFKSIIMKLHFFKHGVISKMLIVFLLFSVFYSCKKTDPLSEPLTSDSEALSKGRKSHPKPSGESADVVYDWYRYIASLQRPTVTPNVFAQNRAFAYIGIGLFEAVQPGIKGGSSFSPKLYQMPAMPKPDMSEDYLWSASANAARHAGQWLRDN